MLLRSHVDTAQPAEHMDQLEAPFLNKVRVIAYGGIVNIPLN